MHLFTSTVSKWFLIGWISVLLGYIMNWIFEGLNLVGLPNIGLAIIIFTFVVKALMIPLSIRQQKYSKLQVIMQPELQLIQEKYKGKSDAASIQAQQQETREVYAKFGTSPTGGCLQMLIQMPILFALYQVIYHLPGHITRLGNYYRGVVEKLMAIPGYETNEAFLAMVKSSGLRNPDVTSDLSLIDVLYKFTSEKWTQFLDIFKNSSLSEAYAEVADKIRSANVFLGIDLSMRPTEQFSKAWWVVLIPLLAGGLQWLSTKLMPQPNQSNNQNQGGAGGMLKSMNIVFPLMSVVFCFMFEAGLGLYWVASSGVQVIIQLFVNRYMDRVDLNEMVQKMDQGELFLYWQVTRGTGVRQHVYPDSDANLWITVTPLKMSDGKTPIKLITEPDIRFHRCDIKTLNLLPAVMASEKAKQAGCGEAVLYRPGGRVTECAHSNVHILQDGTLWTAPLDELILPGISRAHLIKACKALGIPVREEPYYLEQLRAADEILVTSSSKLVVRADKLDGQPCGGKDPETFEKIRKYMLDEFEEATK